MQKPGLNIQSIIKKPFSFEHMVYIIEQIINEQITDQLVQDIEVLYKQSENELLSLDDVLFQIDIENSQKIYDAIEEAFFNEKEQTKKVYISDDELNDIIQANSMEIRDMDISVFCNETEKALKYSEKSILRMLDITLMHLNHTNKQVKKIIKEMKNLNQEQSIEFDHFNNPIFSINSKNSPAEHPIFQIKDIYESKLSYLEEILQKLLINKTIDYYDFLDTSYFYSEHCKIDLFPIPSNIHQNNFFEIASLVHKKHKNNFHFTDFLQNSIEEYVFNNYYMKKVKNNEKNEADLYNDEFSRLSEFQSFTQNLLHFNSSILKFNFINILACKLNPANIFLLPPKNIEATLYELSDTDFLDNFHSICYQNFPVSRKTVFDNVSNQIFNHFDINSVNKTFVSILAKNQTLSLKFSLKIDETHAIFNAKNHQQLLKVAESNTSILQHAPLSFWKVLLTSPNFSSIYRSGIFINAPKATDLYVDEIFTSYLNYNNPDYKNLTLNHDTAVKLFIKLYNHRMVLNDLKNNDEEYYKYGNQPNNKYQLSYEKDFFITILKHIDPTKLQEKITVSDTPSDVAEYSILEMIAGEFNYYGKYYNFDKKIKNEITDEKYAEEVISFLSELNVEDLWEICDDTSAFLPEGVFLSAISLKPNNKIKDFLKEYIQLMLKDVLTNKDTMSDEQIYKNCSTTNKLSSIFAHNKANFSKIPFKYFESALVSVDKVLYRIQNSEYSSNFDYLVRNFNNKSLFADAPEVLNFSDLIDVVASQVSKKEMLKDLKTNQEVVAKVSKNKIRKF